jgi:hypothetical protein
MLRLHRTFGVALVAAGLIAVPPLVPPSPGVQGRAARLASGELAAGNPLDAIGIPLAADLGILPLALIGAAL